MGLRWALPALVVAPPAAQRARASRLEQGTGLLPVLMVVGQRALQAAQLRALEWERAPQRAQRQAQALATAQEPCCQTDCAASQIHPQGPGQALTRAQRLVQRRVPVQTGLRVQPHRRVRARGRAFS